MTAATPTVPRGTKAKPKASDSPPASNGTPTWSPELHEIPIASIDVGSNVRREVAGVEDLAGSIRSVGILQPIRVEEAGAGRYALVYGQRRLAAAKAAGLTTIPALVDAANRTGTVLIVAQLIENLQREDLNPLEEASAMRQLLDADEKLTQAGLAKQLGRAPSTVSNALRILKLPPKVQKRIADGSVSASHAKAIASLPSKEAEAIAERISDGKISAHDVERELAAAQQRQGEADRNRDLAKAAVPRAIAKLEEAGHKPDSVALVVSEPTLRSGLIEAGWQVTTAKSTDLYGAADECAAVAVHWYPNWGSSYGPDLRGVCVVAEHAKARKERAEAEQAEREAEWKRQREQRDREAATARKRQDKDNAAIASYLAAGTWSPDVFRCIVATLADDGSGYLMDEDLVERYIDEEEREGFHELEDPVWALLEKLTDEQVMTELARQLADPSVGNAGARAKLVELAAPAKPKGKAKA